MADYVKELSIDMTARYTLFAESTAMQIIDKDGNGLDR